MFERFKKSKSSRINHPRISLDRVSKSLSYIHYRENVYDPNNTKTDSKIINCFMILGPHESCPEKPSLLFVYPTHTFEYSKESFETIIKFCYPNGLHKSKNEISEQFVFTLTSPDGMKFGICSHFNFNSSSSIFLSATTDSGPFCFVSICTEPIINAHFQMHVVIKDVILDKILEFGEFSSLLPPQQLKAEYDEAKYSASMRQQELTTFTPPLSTRSDDPMIAAVNPYGTSIQLISLLRLYFRIAQDSQGDQVINVTNQITMIIPKQGDTLKEASRYAFDTLFSSFPISTILAYFASIILEQRVILRSYSLSRLTAIGIAALTLTSPMSYRGSLIPILPNYQEFLDYLESPVPFVIGILKDSKIQIQDEDVIYFDVDSGKLKKINLPEIPDRSQLADTLSHCLAGVGGLNPRRQSLQFWQLMQRSGIPTACRSTQKYLFKPEDSDSLHAVFENYVKEFVGRDRLAAARVRDTSNSEKIVTAFVKDAYMIGLSQYAEKYMEFFDMFTSTQTFSNYCDQILARSDDVVI